MRRGFPQKLLTDPGGFSPLFPYWDETARHQKFPFNLHKISLFYFFIRENAYN